MYHIILLLFFISACHSNNNEAPKSIGAAIEVTDFRGQTISLEAPAKRIVCLIESALSGLYMLGVEDRIVGISTNVYTDNTAPQYAALDPRIKKRELSAPGNWDFVSQEGVIALRPDLVIMWASQTEAINALEAKGIPVYGVMLHSIDDVYKEIKNLGKLTATCDRADSIIAFTRAQVASVAELTASFEERKKIYFMWAQGSLSTSGQNSTVNELIELAGGVNVCTAKEEHLIVNLERLIEWNPDIIVMWYNELKNPEDILSMPGWQSINAIKNKNVYELPSVFYYDLWTLKFPHAVQLLATWAYPELLDYMNLDELKKEMMLYLYGEKGEALL